MSRLSASPTDLPMVPRHMPYEKKEKEKMSRSRNGCLTCRIRRKKCTELKDAEGTCEACSRLSIECLGYAEKRPAWMKDHAKLEACKKEIRCWLAERGSQRSKGGRLSLAQYYGDEVPEPLQIVPHMSKPRNPTSSARRQNRKEEAFAWASQSDSDERDELQDEPMNDGTGSPDGRHSGQGSNGAPALPPPHHHLSSAAHNMSRSLASGSGHLSASRSTIKADPNPAAYQQSFLRGGGSEDLNDELESESETELDPKTRSSNSLARVTPNSRNSGGAIVDVGGTTSTFKVSLAPSNPPANETPSLSDIRKYDDFTDQTLVAWGTDAPPNERRFTQSEYARELYQTMWSNKSVQKITRHFLALDCFKKREPGVKIDKAERRRRENELSLAKQLLQQSLEFEKHHDGHGMAAIFGITCVLNRGGTGDWKSFLDMACAWLEREAISILQGATKLSHATAFLAEVTMWIDIMSSPSLRRSPKLQRFYPRFLTNDASQDNHGIYLSKVMGCDNQVLLGIAEASALAGWKEDQLSKGCLDVQRLCDGGRRIEATFLSLPMEVESGPRLTYPQIKSEPNTTSQVVTPPANVGSDSISLNARPGTPSSPKTAVTTNGAIDTSAIVGNQSAPLALALFHATRVYLHTIVSGSYPDIPVIATGVTQGIECLNHVNTGDLDRSIVFTTCVLGSMVRTVEQKNFVVEKFRQLIDGDRMGDLGQVMRLVQEVWSRRERADRRTSVDWWNVSREVGGLVLLA